MMSRALNKKLLPVAVASVLASCISINANAVHVSEDNVGQVLLAPYYNVTNGYKTQVAIVNTRTDVAVKAKVVLRSSAHSTEVLDFLCYMTPADVCRFEIRNVNGQAYMYSDDDSVRSEFNPVTFASQKPVNQQLFDDRMLSIDAKDFNEVGHIEVVGAYAVTAGVVNTGSEMVSVKREMSKHELVKLFDKARGIFNPGGVAVLAGTTSVIASDNPSLVRLTGDVQIVKENGSDRMGYDIPALVGFVGDESAGLSYPVRIGNFIRSFAFDGRVIANSAFDVTVATETAIGNGFGLGGTDNIVELETALSNASIAGTYEKNGSNRSNLMVTFPTKYRHRINHVCSGLPATNAEVSAANYSAPFHSSGRITYSLTSYDNQEHSQVTGDIFSGGSIVTSYLFSEVNDVMPEWPYESGWYSAALNATNHSHDTGLVFDANGNGIADAGEATVTVDSCSYAGVPVLAMTHKYFESNGVTSNSLLLESAKP